MRTPRKHRQDGDDGRLTASRREVLNIDMRLTSAQSFARRRQHIGVRCPTIFPAQDALFRHVAQYHRREAFVSAS